MPKFFEKGVPSNPEGNRGENDKPQSPGAQDQVKDFYRRNERSLDKDNPNQPSKNDDAVKKDYGR